MEARAFEEATRRAAAAQRQAWSGLGSQGAKVLENIEASRRLGSLVPTVRVRPLMRTADSVPTKSRTSPIRPATSSPRLAAAATCRRSRSSRVRRSRRYLAARAARELEGSFHPGERGSVRFRYPHRCRGWSIRPPHHGYGCCNCRGAVLRFNADGFWRSSCPVSGRAAGVTAGQINAIAPAAAAAGGVSVRQAREMAVEFAATG